MNVVFIALIIIIVILYAVSLMYEKYSADLSGGRNEIITKLIRQAYRWYIAAKQDTNPLIKGLHANYAVSYCSALKSIASEKEIMRISGLDIRKLQSAAESEQDKSVVEITGKCPDLVAGDTIYAEYLQKLVK